mmetsp:Transcript_92404/g.138364  ORF Transcript_92404/g.138364 Transcript_92404/m.138364 type:complete len:162 (+) Transcript_92404:16-501(+)
MTLLTMVSSLRSGRPILLLVLTFSSVTAQWSNASACTEAEVLGINMCQSAGEGFALSQAKLKSCPQSSDEDPSLWTCEQWQCHVFCSNPVRPEARKSCDNCDEVTVSDECWKERQGSCDTAKTALSSCDVLCSTATMQRSSAVWMGVAVMMSFIASLQRGA